MSETGGGARSGPAGLTAAVGPSDEHDRHRAWRIRRGRQAAVDVPVATLRVVARSSAHSRDALTRALGAQTVDALVADPDPAPDRAAS